MVIEHFERSKMNQTKTLKLLIDNGAVGCLPLLERAERALSYGGHPADAYFFGNGHLGLPALVIGDSQRAVVQLGISPYLF